MRNYRKGFTLIETLVVLVLIAIFMLIANASFKPFTDQAKGLSGKSVIENAIMQQRVHSSETGYYSIDAWEKLPENVTVTESVSTSENVLSAKIEATGSLKIAVLDATNNCIAYIVNSPLDGGNQKLVTLSDAACSVESF